MPIIPLPTQQRALPNLPAQAMNREKFPTINNNGVINAVARLGSVKQPELPAGALSAPYEALGAVGKAIQQGGNILTGLAIKRQQATTDYQLAGIDTEMDVEIARFEQWKTQTNAAPDTLEAEWQKRITGLQQRLEQRKDLTPGAREQLGVRIARFAGQTQARVMAGAAKDAFAMAKSGFAARLDRAIEDQTPEEFEGTLKTGEDRGYFYPHEAEGYRQQFKRTGERKQREAEAAKEKQDFELHATEAIADPTGWLERNGTPWNGKELLWQRIKNTADARQREVTTAAVDDVVNAIADGTITVESEVDAWSSALTPKLREDAKSYLRSRDAYAEKIDREQNGVRNAVEMRKRVQDYDPASDPDRTRYFELVREIGARVEQSMAGEITSELFQKYGRDTSKLKVRPEIQQNISKSVDSMFDPKYGSIRWKIDEWQQVPKDPFGKEKKWELVTITDEAAKQRALDAQTQIEMKMADFFKENPGATLQDAKKKLMEVLPEGTRASALDALQKLKKPAAPSASAGKDDFRGYVDAGDLRDRLPPGLQSHAQDYIDAAREYGLNPRVLAAISAFETAEGTSPAFRNKHNAMGISDDNGPIEMPSVRDSIFRQAKSLARPDGHYRDARTLEEVGAIYAPPGAKNDPKKTNAGWAKGVRAHLAKLEGSSGSGRKGEPAIAEDGPAKKLTTADDREWTSPFLSLLRILPDGVSVPPLPPPGQDRSEFWSKVRLSIPPDRLWELRTRLINEEGKLLRKSGFDPEKAAAEIFGPDDHTAGGGSVKKLTPMDREYTSPYIALVRAWDDDMGPAPPPRLPDETPADWWAKIESRLTPEKRRELRARLLKEQGDKLRASGFNPDQTAEEMFGPA